MKLLKVHRREIAATSAVKQSGRLAVSEAVLEGCSSRRCSRPGRRAETLAGSRRCVGGGEGPGGSARNITSPMTLVPRLTLLLVALCMLLSPCLAANHVFTNDFLVKIQDGNNELAHRVARRNGFINRGPVSIEDEVSRMCDIQGSRRMQGEGDEGGRK